jgi:UTP--glucose-1-phosphate uridylyltransferase
MIAEFEQQKAGAVIAFEEVPPAEVVHYGIAKPESSPGDIFALSDIVEKPSVREAPSQLAVAARYVFSAEIFAFLHQTEPGKANEIQLTDAIRKMIAAGRKVLGIKLSPDEPRQDIGNFESYFRAFIEYALADPQCGPTVRRQLEELLGKP